MDLWTNREWTPMLLGETSQPFNSRDYIYELKFDGTRTIIFASPKTIKIYNRRNIDITYLYPELDALRHLVKRNTIFDGEIIALEEGLPSFSKLQERSHLKDKNKIKYQSIHNPIIFVCYDLLYDNKNLVDLSLQKRKSLLNKYPENDFFIKSKYIEEKGIELFKSITKLNLEGIVAKKKDSIYEIGKRSNSWLKIKNLIKKEFYIGGFVEKKDSFVISLILGEYRHQKLYYVGKVSLGKKTPLYQEIKKRPQIKRSPFQDFNEEVKYLKPVLTCTIKYMERTKNNHLRQPFISFDS